MLTINIQVDGDAKKLIEDNGLTPRMLQGMARAMDQQNELTVFHIQRAYQSFPADGPTVDIGLRFITGRLRQSLHRNKAEIIDDSITSSIGSEVPYATAHEFGATTQPHDIFPKAGKALAFQLGGRTVFAKVVHHPGSRIPARATVQRGIADRADDYSAALSKAILNAWQS